MQTVVLEPVGARVTGISLAALDAPAVTELKQILAQHGVVVLPDQHIDDDTFLDVLQRFGRLTFATGETPVPTSYLANPPVYTALRAVEIPSQGGETLFTNQYTAVETLPREVRERLEGRTIHHVVTGLDLTEHEETEADHPILRTHPLSGRTALYMSTPARCAAVSGMTKDEADALVRYLYEPSTRDENVVRHAWSPGDVVIWDNRCVLHRGDHADVIGDRVMHRGMVVDDDGS